MHFFQTHRFVRVSQGHDENVQLFLSKSAMSNDDYVQKVIKKQAHVQDENVQVENVQV